MFLGGLFMIYLLLKEHYLDMTTEPCARCKAVDNAIFKAFGYMIWESMRESVTEKRYGCSGVVGEEVVVWWEKRVCLNFLAHKETMMSAV